MERMSALDAGLFLMERDNVPMHVGWVAVFEGPRLAYGDLIRLLVSKLPQVPRYRQLLRTAPLHLGRPAWIDDDHFEVLYHVRHSAVPVPGGVEQLRNLAGRVFAQRLDLVKPLWEMWLAEGLQGGRWALISKVHLCMIDGVAGWDLAAALLDTTPDAEHPGPGPWVAEHAPSTAWRSPTGCATRWPYRFSSWPACRRWRAICPLARRRSTSRGDCQGLCAARPAPLQARSMGPVGPIGAGSGLGPAWPR